ncbi:MAG: hypothetical protein QOG58_3945 [Caballeronia sp.]|nr:hypothetical protein [Caballeronia sp.]
MRAIQRKPLYEWSPQSSVSVEPGYLCIVDSASTCGYVPGAGTCQPVIHTYKTSIPKQEQSDSFMEWSCSGKRAHRISVSDNKTVMSLTA